MTRSGIDFTRVALEVLVTLTASAEFVVFMCVICTLNAVTCSWAITVVALVVSMSINVAAAHRMADSSVVVAVISVVAFLTLTVAFKVTLGVVIALDTVLTSRARASEALITNCVTGVHVEAYATVVACEVGIANTSLVGVAVSMRYTLDTVSSIWSETLAVTKSVAASSVDVVSTVVTAPVWVTLAFTVLVPE